MTHYSPTWEEIDEVIAKYTTVDMAKRLLELEHAQRNGQEGEAVALLREIDDSGLLFRHNIDLDAKVANFLSVRSATSKPFPTEG